MDLTTFVQKCILSKNLHWKTALKLYPVELKRIKEQTSFLPSNTQPNARYYCIINNIQNHPTCKTCQSPVGWTRLMSKGFKQYCNTRCKNLDPTQQAKMKEGIVKKYGIDNVSKVRSVVKKRSETNQQRYGGHPMQLVRFKDKTKQTNQQRYGVDHPMQLQQFKDKAERTNQEKYGARYIQQIEAFRNKTKQTNQQKYGSDFWMQQHFTEDTLQKLNNPLWLQHEHHVLRKTLSQIACDLGFNHMTTLARYFRLHGVEIKHFYQSRGERELLDWLSQYVEVESNQRNIISPYELDIFIPKLKIAIEYCGLYWHSEQQGKTATYHQNKLLRCQSMGIQLITIFEDEWQNKKHQVQSKLKAVIGCDDRLVVYGRKTNTTIVAKKRAQTFMDQYHIQSKGPCSVQIGLEYGTELVACATFRQNKPGIYELTRYATKYHVPGGFSKLISFFQRTHDWVTIITFADLRWSSGALYKVSGWLLDKTLRPDFSYIIGNRRSHKFNYRRKYLPTKLKHFDPSKSERVNCDENGLFRIWDCGKLRFTLQNDSPSKNHSKTDVTR